MKREVVLTPRAQVEIENVFAYLELKWNEKTKKQFSNKINTVLSLIVENPELFPVSSVNRKIRKAVISKQSTLFYHFNSKHIIVLSVFDTRQNPTKINKIK
ncbi:MAG TPA: type II toxin-antitoxin system RelE/ParE family toxin [Flavobacterium sp.]|nr:type II toxin-antitoxin system RelE/ParE family toxin [Flavobacterium sp.]HAT76445.1 type II toxin-antitoxin system RelE/ParE family toxin [Flavobacterium sp.]HAT79883.1 type II toxin-antitoxin system RelE/ParE family toxin [Flavobacterium sp.]